MAAAREKKGARDESLPRLKAQIKEKALGRLYFFSGEEEYLKSYYFDVVKNQLLEGPAEEFNYHRFDSESFDMNAITDAVEAIPMMSERSLIRIDDYDPFKGDEAERTQWANLLDDLPDYVCVVFYYETVAFKPDRRQKRLAGIIEDKGEAISFEKQPERELISWIVRRFRSYNIDIQPSEASYLLFITDGLMNSLISEIEKIAAFSENRVITQADIDAVVEPVMTAVVFDITTLLANGAYGRALNRLQQLLKKGEEPLPVLGAIGAQFRRMRAAKLLRANGEGTDAVVKLCGIQPFAAGKLMEAAAKVSLEFCSAAVLLCEETDLRMKSSFEDGDKLLELLLLRLAEAVKHG